MSRWAIASSFFTAAMVIMAMAVPGGVVIEGQLKGTAIAGSTAPLSVNISKGGLDYFGRILLQVPPDCRLDPTSLYGGRYHWDAEKHIAVVSWLKLPDQSRFNIEFDLAVAPGAAAGDREIGWEFSFIRNNDRATVTPPPFHFTIRETTTPDTPSTSFSATDLPSPSTVSNAQNPSASRTLTEADGGVRVEVRIENLHNGGFVKLMENPPFASSARIINSAGGVADITNEGLSFIWFDYVNSGSVTYQLDDCRLSQVQNFLGRLSHIEGDQSVEIDVVQMLNAENRPQKIPVESGFRGDVRFEVQIAATKNPVVTDYFERKLNFRFQTREEHVEEWYKYTHNSFNSYEDARNHRVSLTEAYAFRKPFVVGRRGNQRISVQEALTSTHQTWIP